MSTERPDTAVEGLAHELSEVKKQLEIMKYRTQLTRYSATGGWHSSQKYDVAQVVELLLSHLELNLETVAAVPERAKLVKAKRTADK